MKIGVIQASSQRAKNEMLYQCTVNAVNHNDLLHEVINFGLFQEDFSSFSYIEAAMNVSLLLSSGAVDFIVTGCSSGQGMMLACNSLPSVICGYIQNPQDAFLFGRINDGNAVSLPLGLNFGWQGDINLQCTLDKLFEGEFGCGYPPEDAERKMEDTRVYKELNAITKRTMSETFSMYDSDLMKKVLSWNNVREYILEFGVNEEIKSMIETKWLEFGEVQ